MRIEGQAQDRDGSDDMQAIRAAGRVHWANHVRRNAHQVPVGTAVRHRGESITWAELGARLERAATVMHRLGVGPGDRVALLLTNVVEYVELTTAAMSLGAIVVPMNFRLTGHEAAFILEDSEPSILFLEQATLDLGVEASRLSATAAASILIDGPQGGHPRSFDFASLVAEGGTAPGAIDVPEDTPCLLLYTSGTTGRPKGAVLTHANMQQQTATMIRAWNLVNDSDVYLCSGPLFHAAGMGALGAFLFVGATIALHPSGAFSPADILNAVESERATILFLVPTQWHDLLAELDIERRCRTLRLVGWGSAPATLALLERIEAALPGIPNIAMFGQSELSPTTCVLDSKDAARKIGSVGKPVAAVQIRVVDDQMNDVPAGQVGEIVYRGSTLMSSYWRRPEATAEAFAGGWFHSGDLVRVDNDGFVFVVDRKKDMIISGGENIFCAELENVIVKHPCVDAVAVIGRSHERWGEVPVAVIVPSAGKTVTLEQIRGWCITESLSRFKLPRAVEIVSALDTNASGKVMKATLRQRFGRAERPAARGDVGAVGDAPP